MSPTVVTDALNAASESLLAGLAALFAVGLAVVLILTRLMRRRPVRGAVERYELSDGSKAMEGARRYVLRLPRSRVPPPGAFWSVMAYSAQGEPVGAAVADRGLRFGRDGSLKLYVQASSPGGAKVDNWLPAPATGAFRLVARLYWPAGAVRRAWAPPKVRRVG